MKYKCICGQEFNTSQQFNSHRASCKIYLSSINRLDYVNKRHKEIGIKSGQTRKIRNELDRKNKLNKWVSEKHVCENCGKIMTEKFGSGRFCSRACANTRIPNNTTKNKIKSSLIGRKTGNGPYTREKYNKSPKICPICGSIIAYEKRHYKTCSYECRVELLSKNMRQRVIKYHGNVNHKLSNYKSGYYKGIRCDSSYELAYLVYNLECGNNIRRNYKSFEYIFNGKKHLYYPDFIIDDTYVEIKNYSTQQVQEKIKQFPHNIKYKILYGKDIKHCIKYCKEKYGKNYYINLYD